MSDLARLDHRLDKLRRIADIRGNPHRRDAHRSTIGGAVAPGLFRGVAGEDHVDCALGRRAEQILRTLGAHYGFPIDQALGEHRRLDLACAFHQQLADQDRLFSVIGDGAGRHVWRDGLVGVGVFQGGDGTETLLHLLAAQGLGRHAQSVAQGQTVEGAKGAICRGHFDAPNCRCRRKCSGSSRLSTYSMKRSRRS